MDREFPDYVGYFTRERVRSLCVAFLLLGLSLIFQSYSSEYSTANSGRFVGDLFLDHLPSVNLNSIIIEGAFLAILFTLALVLLRPHYLIFSIKVVALFIAVRSFFVAVTHLGIYPTQVLPGNGFIDQVYVALNLQAGYFFSAHTGLPFLFSLIFWNDRLWRYTYLAISILFGTSVLLAHTHYSIDVFASPFMAYSIFKLAQYLFDEDYKLVMLG